MAIEKIKNYFKFLTSYKTLHAKCVKQVLPISHADSKGTTVVCFKLQSSVSMVLLNDMKNIL